MFNKIKHMLTHKYNSNCTGDTEPGMISSERWYWHIHDCNGCTTRWTMLNDMCADFNAKRKSL